jgi:hypothetical protein
LTDDYKQAMKDVINLLMIQHEAAKGSHNYWQVAANLIQAEQPAQRTWVGLTDEEISSLWDGHTVLVFGKTGINPIVFARAIEAKLKEKNT